MNYRKDGSILTLCDIGAYSAGGFPGSLDDLQAHIERLINAQPISGYKADDDWRRWKRAYEKQLIVGVLRRVENNPTDPDNAGFAAQLLMLARALDEQGYTHPGYYP